MPEPQKPKSKLELMRESIANRQKEIDAAKPPVAAAATKPKRGKKPKPKGPAHMPPKIAGNGFRQNRSAKARDERHRKRGRMPDGYGVEGHYQGGGVWVGQARVPYSTGPLAPMIAWQATHTSDGLFRMLEEMDMMFWEWYSHKASDEDKANIKWSKSSKPEGPSDVNAQNEAAAQGERQEGAGDRRGGG